MAILGKILIVAVFSFLVGLMMAGSVTSNLEKITPWLLGINFTLAIFSMNFTFFGQQLSKYKAIYSEITKRQWFNIGVLSALPFVPVVSYLIFPEFFERSALWIMPLLMLSAIDNATLTARYLSPGKYMRTNFTDDLISRYLLSLSKKLKKEVKEHQQYLESQKEINIPSHSHNFEPTTFGLEANDVWDSITVIITLAVENDDYPVFRQSVNVLLKLAASSYAFDCKCEDSYQINSGIQMIAGKRMRSIVNRISDDKKSEIFIQALSNELSTFLMKEDVVTQPCSDLARSIASDMVWLGQKTLESNGAFEPLKTLNTLHAVIEIGIQRLKNPTTDDKIDITDEFYIALYAHDIKIMGVTALNNNNPHFAYRCIEGLSFLGCNAAKIESRETIIAVFEALVHLGRVARNLKIGCFWSRCLIPVESHVEEFMGHILTWLVQDLDASGNFYMKEYAEQSYSRLRGVKCIIKPKTGSNPCFWIEELKKDGKTVPHIEYESGMYGYGGKADYSDFKNLKEYVLDGIGSDSEVQIFHSEPIPLQTSEDENPISNT